jgi:hypothetical protein
VGEDERHRRQRLVRAEHGVARQRRRRDCDRLDAHEERLTAREQHDVDALAVNEPGGHAGPHRFSRLDRTLGFGPDCFEVRFKGAMNLRANMHRGDHFA